MSSELQSKASLVKLESSKMLEQYFKLIKKLGEGTFGVVVSAIDKRDGNIWAVKKIVKNRKFKGLQKSWEREFIILSKISHPNIIKLKEMFETEHFAYLILEYCDGNTLTKQLKKFGKFSDFESSNIIYQLSTALSYLHRRQIVHRDVKLDNILLRYRKAPSPPQTTSILPKDSISLLDLNNPTNSATPTIELVEVVNDRVANDNAERQITFDVKLADFGLAMELKNQERMIEFCGTPMYMAPEIITGKSYTRQCDVWSIGIIMCMLLTGQPPFKTTLKEQQLFQEIQNLNLEKVTEIRSTIKPSAYNCLQHLLHLDPAYRFTMYELLMDNWTIQSIEVLSQNADATETSSTNVLQLMKDYHHTLNLTGNKNSTSNLINTTTNTL